MFKNRTVFILGAGASWHYGYPTGEDLVKKVIQKCEDVATYLEFAKGGNNAQAPQFIMDKTKESNMGKLADGWAIAQNECRELKRRLEQVNPLVIDYFLGHNPTFQSFGKLMVAWVILECATRYRKHGNFNRPEKADDDWYRFIIHKLMAGCVDSKSLLKNDVRFVTFNYDLSLEHGLYNGLRALERFDEADILAFLEPNRIMHVYGQVGDSPPPMLVGIDPNILNPQLIHAMQNGRFPVGELNEVKATIDNIYVASKKIQTIDPDSKIERADVISMARDEISNASCVYILGYGFDENNNKRLGLDESLNLARGPINRKVILFTNYRDFNLINKRASRLFFHDSISFLPPQHTRGDMNGPFYCEKSVRNTYDALAMDFDSIEEQFSGPNGSG